MKEPLYFDKLLVETLAQTSHFENRVTRRVFQSFITLTPIGGGKIPTLSKDEMTRVAKRIKRAIGESIAKIKGSNAIRRSGLDRFQIIQIPQIVVMLEDGELLQPTYKIKNPDISGTVYYVVGRNASLKTVLLLPKIEGSNSMILSKMMSHLKRAKDLVDNPEFKDFFSDHVSIDWMMDKTDVMTAKEGAGTDKIIIEMAASDEQFEEYLQAVLNGTMSAVKKTEEPNVSHQELLDGAQSVAIPEKQIIIEKGKPFPIKTNEGFLMTKIVDFKFKKDPNHVVIFTEANGIKNRPSLICRESSRKEINQKGLDKYNGIPLTVREKIWIKASKVTEFDLETAKKLFGLPSLGLKEMEYALFYGEVDTVTQSSRDGLIVKIKPSDMVLYYNGKVINSFKKGPLV
jgi:hypothetical protein